MQQENAQDGYRDDIFNADNLVGFASKQTMYQAHALYFDAPAGSGVLLPSGTDDYTRGRQVLNKESLNFLIASEGNGYNTFNQSYKRVAGEFFASVIQKASQESVLKDTAATLETTTQPQQIPQQEIEDRKPTAISPSDIAIGIPVGGTNPNFPLSYFPEPVNPETGRRVNLAEGFPTAMQDMVADFESLQPITERPDARQATLQREDSGNTLQSSALYEPDNSQFQTLSTTPGLPEGGALEEFSRPQITDNSGNAFQMGDSTRALFDGELYEPDLQVQNNEPEVQATSAVKQPGAAALEEFNMAFSTTETNVAEAPADIPLAFKPDEADVAIGPETTFEEKFARAMQGMFSDFEDTKQQNTLPDTRQGAFQGQDSDSIVESSALYEPDDSQINLQGNRRDALQKNESEMAVYNEAMYVSERKFGPKEAVAPATSAASQSARPTLAGFGKPQNFAKRAPEPKGKQGKQTTDTQKKQGKKGRSLFRK